MKDFEGFSDIDFASNDEFIEWVKRGSEDQENDLKWKNWISDHPSKMEVIERARGIVLSVLSEDPGNHALVKSAVWSRIHDTIEEPGNLSKNKRTKLWLPIAASITIVMCIGVLFFINRGDVFDRSQDLAVSNIHVNDTHKNKTFVLPDGSSVILYPNSSIQLLSKYGQKERGVKLSGKGYFEVVKDPKIQFVVETEHLMTRVLGTSFLISSYLGENHSVEVNTGKVSVHGTSSPKKSMVLLTPKEKVEYNTETGELLKKEDEELVISKAYDDEFVFRSTPLREVFERISLTYGFKIDTADARIGECQLNASLTGIPLEDKLRLICKASNLEYEIDERTIRLEGQGCE